MKRLRAWLLRCAGLFRKEQGSREFAEEMESHILAHVDDNLRLGMSAEEARRQALIGSKPLSLPLLICVVEDDAYCVTLPRA